MLRTLIADPRVALMNWSLVEGANQRESGSAPLVNMVWARPIMSPVVKPVAAEAEAVVMAMPTPVPKPPRIPAINGAAETAETSAADAEAVELFRKIAYS